MTSSVANTLLTRIGGLLSSPYFQRKRPISRRRGPVGLQDMVPPSIGMRLAALVGEHSDLDIAISVLLEAGNCDDLLISRLKKRKLQIKDEIASITPSAKDSIGAAMQQEMISCVA